MTTTSKQNDFVQSPLNYTGGKFKLLSQLYDKFPEDITVFYDIFSGGANVAANITCESIRAVDSNAKLVALLQFLQTQSYAELIENLHATIAQYELSNSNQHGYEYYGCNSANGLGQYNKEKYLALRADYNESPSNLLFLLLIIFGFNNQIRFNRRGGFNIPVGKRDFNAAMHKKLQRFMQHIQDKNIQFACQDFRQLDIEQLAREQAFLYLDPPYLLGTASYNENGGWTTDSEKDLLDFLVRCDAAGMRFALSNVIAHKGETHDLLSDICVVYDFNIHEMSHTYANANYQRKNREKASREVLVTNY